MSAIFIICAAAAVTTFVMMVKKQKEDPEKKYNTGLALVFCLFLGVAAFSFMTSKDNSTVFNTQLTQNEINKLSTTDYAKYLVQETIGDKTNDDKPVLRKVFDTKTYLLIDLNAGNDDSFYGLKSSILNDSAKIYKKAFTERPDLQGLKLVWYADRVDIRGNSTEGVVLYFLFTKDNAKSVNWDNVEVNNLPYIADEYKENSDFK